MSELALEMAEKAIAIAKELGKTKGIYSTYDKDKLHINYSSHTETISVFYGYIAVLQVNEGFVYTFRDGNWVEFINREYRKAKSNGQD